MFGTSLSSGSAYPTRGTLVPSAFDFGSGNLLVGNYRFFLNSRLLAAVPSSFGARSLDAMFFSEIFSGAMSFGGTPFGARAGMSAY